MFNVIIVINNNVKMFNVIIVINNNVTIIIRNAMSNGSNHSKAIISESRLGRERSPKLEFLELLVNSIIPNLSVNFHHS